MAATLAEAILAEQKRVRALIVSYRMLPNNAGVFGATLMENCLEKVEKAAMEQDTVMMVGLLQEMQGFE